MFKGVCVREQPEENNGCVNRRRTHTTVGTSETESISAAFDSKAASARAPELQPPSSLCHLPPGPP